MSRRVNFTLNDEQRANLEQAINYFGASGGAPAGSDRRPVAAPGTQTGGGGSMVAITANTVWTWHRRFRQNAVAGRQDQPKSGRKRKADARYVRLLEQLLETDPASLGPPVTIWTIDRLRLYPEEQTEVLLSPARFRALLHRLGYRWKTAET
ncbi:MAG: helix-turn-helix domain-containing protein [Chloroflexi bacterium]|nr:helix-turn-helix domain-containing protein [Chloroflexota bacterium]